jgi:uncharacterized protein (UPF0548 family)
MPEATTMPAALASRLRAAELTYSEAGQSAGALPPGYHHLHRSVVIGSGAQAFADAAHALLTWRMHMRAGLRVAASSALAEPGAVVVLSAGAGRSLAPATTGDEPSHSHDHEVSLEY